MLARRQAALGGGALAHGNIVHSPQNTVLSGRATAGGCKAQQPANSAPVADAVSVQRPARCDLLGSACTQRWLSRVLHCVGQFCRKDRGLCGRVRAARNWTARLGLAVMRCVVCLLRSHILDDRIGAGMLARQFTALRGRNVMLGRHRFGLARHVWQPFKVR